MTRESIVSNYNTEEALGDKPLELVRPTNHVQEHNTIHHQILEVCFIFIFIIKLYFIIIFYLFLK